MTATARIAIDRVPGVLLAPTEAVFQHDGRPVVYRLHGVDVRRDSAIDVIAARTRAGRDCLRRQRRATSSRPAGPIRIRSGGRREAARRCSGSAPASSWPRSVGTIARGPFQRCPIAAPRLPTDARHARPAEAHRLRDRRDLRAGRTATLVAPPAGGTLRLVKLVPTGTAVKAGDVVFEIDPADQEFALEQAKSELAEAEQQIVKIKADSAVQAAEDQVALLTARYDVRRGELDTAGERSDRRDRRARRTC